MRQAAGKVVFIAVAMAFLAFGPESVSTAAADCYSAGFAHACDYDDDLQPDYVGVGPDVNPVEGVRGFASINYWGGDHTSQGARVVVFTSEQAVDTWLEIQEYCEHKGEPGQCELTYSSIWLEVEGEMIQVSLARYDDGSSMFCIQADHSLEPDVYECHRLE